MSSPESPPLGELNPDYLLLVAFPQTDGGSATEQAQENVSKLLTHLEKSGFYTQVRPADAGQLLVFVKASDSIVLHYLKSKGVKEYLYGARGELDSEDALVHQLTTTTRLNAVHALITDPLADGGAGITTGSNEWGFITKISPLWDYDDNKRLLKSFLKPSFDELDIEKIRAIAGDKVALYFAFTRFYLLALFVPAGVGLVSHVLFKRFSLVYTVLNTIWAIVFLAAWKKKQSVYALKWGNTGVSKVEIKRIEFSGEASELDPITGDSVPSFSPVKRSAIQLAFVPVAFAAVIVLVSYQLTCFFIEIFLTEIYQGPGKGFLGLVPTVLIVGAVPIITAFYEKIVDKALICENHEYQSTYNRSKLQKMYVYNFFSSYVPLFITVFFYLPFGHALNSYVPIISALSSKYNIPVIQERYQINNDRLINQFGYFTLTAQIVGLALENVVPVTIRLVKEKLNAGKSVAGKLDSAQEAAYLSNVRQQISMPEFDVDAEYRELVMQFGYLVLFGPVWSLAPLVSIFFNWFEIRGDAEKLLFECSRPVPRYVESIKPWDTHMDILTWLGSFIAPLVTVMYRCQAEVLASENYSFASSPVVTPGWKLASTALIAENLSLGINFAVKSLFNSFVSTEEKEHNQQQLLMRRSYVSAYTKDSSLNKRYDVEIDPTTSTWKQFSSASVIKSALGLPGLLVAAAASSTAKENGPATGKKVAGVSAEPVSITSNSGFQQHSSSDNAHLRSTTASKIVPQTAGSASAINNVPLTTSAPKTTVPANEASQFNPILATSAGSGAVATGAALSVNAKPSETASSISVSENSEFSADTSPSVVPSDKAAINVPAPDTARSTETPTKKKGIFGFAKKDILSVGKAAKADASKMTPELKKLTSDLKHGDLSSTKKLGPEIKAHPREYFGNTEKAVKETRHTQSAGSNAPSSAINPSVSDAHVPSTAPPVSSDLDTSTHGVNGSDVGLANATELNAAATGVQSSPETPAPSTAEKATEFSSAATTPGAALGSTGATGLSSERLGSSTPSSTGSVSLAGATLPPDFEKRAASVSLLRKSASSTASALAPSVDSTAAPSISTPQKQSLDPKISTPLSYSSNTGDIAGAGAAVAAGVQGVATKLSSNGEGSGNATSTWVEKKDSLVDSAKQYAEKGSSTLNDNVQIAADKVDDYAKKTNNQYVQRLADGVEEYTQKHEANASSASATAASPIGETFAAQISETPAAPTLETPATPSQQQFVKAETPKTKLAVDSLPEQFTNSPSHDLAPPTPLGGSSDAHSQHSAVSSPRKKKGLLSKIKDKVAHSPHGTPKKH